MSPTDEGRVRPWLADWQRPVGMRLAPWDAPVLCLGVVGVVLAATMSQSPWSLVGALLGTVVGHFFLFCNIVRLRTRLELVWATGFVLNVGVWASLGELSIAWILTTQTPLTLALCLWQIRAADYHGVFARRLNRRLGTYLAGRQSGGDPVARPT
jgi:hypothetical protein